MAKLYLLGPPELRVENGGLDESFLSGPKRLGLLVYLVLATPKGFVRRDTLLPLFWPTSDQKSARNALSNIIYHLRKSLGSEMIINRGNEEIKLGKLWCDVNKFEEAIRKENFEKAVEYYRGNLLEGVHVSDASQKFNQWMDQERQRYHRKYSNVIEQLAQQKQRQGDTKLAVEWWYKASREAPYDAEITRSLMEALVAVGKKAEALEAGRKFSRHIEEELGADAEKEYKKLTDGLGKSIDTSLQGEAKVDKAPIIAVVPFKNLNKGDSQSADLTNSMETSLRAKLANISVLRVVAGSSVLPYRNQSIPVSEMAKELNVDTILEGDLQVEDKNATLDIRLSTKFPERLLWAERYDFDCEIDKIQQIQNEIIKKTADALQINYSGDEKERVKIAPGNNLKAYFLYTKAKSHLENFAEPNLYEAEKHFKKAVEYDSSSALAWAGLAESQCLINLRREAEPESLNSIKATVQKAMELEPEAAEAHKAKGLYHICRKEGPATVRELKQAIKLKPSCSEANLWLAWVHMLLGQQEEAGGLIEHVLELDGQSPKVCSYSAIICLADGQYDCALEKSRWACQIQPDLALNHFVLGLVLYHLERYSEALFALEEAAALEKGNSIISAPEIWSVLAAVHAAKRNTAEVEKLLARVRETQSSFPLALVQIAGGQLEKALNTFENVTSWSHLATACIRYLFPELFKPIRENGKHKKILQQVDQYWGL